MESDQLTIAIDPGTSGAIALLDGRALIDVWDIPVVEVTRGKTKRKEIAAQLLADELREFQAKATVVVERVHAMPKQGVTSVFGFGRSFGVIEGVIAGLGMPIQYVTPAEWKKALRLGRDKEDSRAMALQVWPEMSRHFARKKDADRAEAALIGLFAVGH